MCWTVVLMLKTWTKMEYRLDVAPWSGVRLNRNRCYVWNDLIKEERLRLQSNMEFVIDDLKSYTQIGLQ